MGARVQALRQNRPQDPPAVAKRPQLALRAGDPRVVRHVDLDDPEPPRHRFAGQLGLDLEAARPEPYRVAITSAKGAIAREQVAIRRADQEPECRADETLPRPRVKSSRLHRLLADGPRRPCRPRH